ncbi:HlyC/CorC family transporter [bacterium]|nr:HlyC/CorC family transporter [bacterium]
MIAAVITLVIYGVIVIYIYAVSIAENAAFALNAENIRSLVSRNEPIAKWLSERLKKPREFIQYFVIVKTFLISCLLVVSIIFNSFYFHWTIILATGLLTWNILILYANAFPGKAIRRNRVEKALRWIPFVRFLGWLIWPFIILWRAALRFLVPEGGIGGPLTIERELDELMPDGKDFASLETDEKEMIRHVVEFRSTTVREIMVPRIDMVCISHDETPTEAVEVITVAGHTRVPVYKERIDNVVGVLYAKDLLNAISSEQKISDLTEIARAPYFVPESKLTNDLLRELRRECVHMAIIVDEYGGTAGLVTLEDLIEEIVGEIQDEYDFEEIPIRKLSENVYNVLAKLPIDEVNEELGIELPEDDSETLGGFIYGIAGAIPNAGDKFEFENILFVVESVSGQRLKNVKIVIKNPEEEG